MDTIPSSQAADCISMNDLYILDAVGFLFRSYYAIRGMTNKDGASTGALYGFIRSVQKLITDFSPGQIVAVFDGPNNKASRVAIYADYKGHREGMPEDLIPQLGLAIEYCKLAGIPLMQVEGVEADDTIASIATWAENLGSNVFICSSDKDLAQLVSKKVRMLNTGKDNLLIDEKKVEEIYGVRPDQILDYLAIVGDSADNIPGLPGFGPKTATTLLAEFDTLDELLKNADKLKGKKRETVENESEIALISKRLATLDMTIDFPKDPEFFHVNEPDHEGLQKLFHEMNFKTLLETQATSDTNVSYHIVEDVEAFVQKFKDVPHLCFDTETDSLNTMQARMVGIGFSVNAGEGYYIPINDDETVEKLRPLLENTPLIAHNLKYDLHVLANHGIFPKKLHFDTMIASYILSPHANRHGLDALSLEHFGFKKTPIKELIGTGKKQISMRDVPIEKVGPYCCEDVDYTYRLFELFDKQLSGKLLELFKNVEMPLLPILLKMERTGIYLDVEELKTKSTVLKAVIEKHSSEIFAIAGEEFNINSPKQLAAILFDKLEIPVKKRTTRADVLEAMTHPIAREILAYRSAEKLRSTYVDALPLQVNPNTHRIHCSFNQAGTATGRLACQDPNLQNIPIRSEEGRKIREAFKAKDGCSFLSADYSQIELRLMAHFSGEEKLINAFKDGADIHASCASIVFDVPLDEVTSEMRSKAKAVNFGIIYGQQAFGLSQGLAIDLKEAAKFIKAYFEKYPKVKAFIEESKETVRKEGHSTTLLGRERPIPEISSPNGMIRSASERLAVNTPLQGSQADIIKLAMIEIDKQVDQAPMILQIHDELIFEVPDNAIEHVKHQVVTIMENIYPLSIPLTVDVSIGKNWGEC
ncbi:MAG: DNA polymerase I [Chlamydiia bacterium]|nr:DNA polymerase I [Chlamydiia bacterium]MCH9616480.1 DNA polymerase I [Chlamydiia bacterium]MCH9629534.1 DNA polymerase I [Chlamydiia bacterium]